MQCMRFFDSTAILDKSTILLCTIEDNHKVFSKGISLLSHPSLMQIQLYIWTRSKTGSWKLEMSKSPWQLCQGRFVGSNSHTSSSRKHHLRRTSSFVQHGKQNMVIFQWSILSGLMNQV
ncbi:hypothetical protein PAXRUDRAFT_800741, partial [Paxillus rubicundulus Ve08.2h10]